MARVKIRIGDNEVEVDSRDFYVDNQSVGQVIADVSRHLVASSAVVYEDAGEPVQAGQEPESGLAHLKSLQDAEVHEPEFSTPVQISAAEVRSKLEILEENSFFELPRTVSETVGQLHEYGWIASPLDVSRTLTKMVFHRELAKGSQDNRNYYMIKDELLAS